MSDLQTELRFIVSQDELDRIDRWYDGLRARIVEQQRDQFIPYPNDDEREPYYGTIGGGLTYEFTPTSIGVQLVVREIVTGERIDITDYDNW